jgi:hypothetical protein
MHGEDLLAAFKASFIPRILSEMEPTTLLLPPSTSDDFELKAKDAKPEI